MKKTLLLAGVLVAGMVACQPVPEGVWALDRAATMVDEGDRFSLHACGPMPDTGWKWKRISLPVESGRMEKETLYLVADRAPFSVKDFFFMNDCMVYE